MAGRPIKQGLDYFSLDVDFFQSAKVRRIIKGCGCKAVSVLICLLANIYRKDGYFLRWDGDMGYMIAEEIGAYIGSSTPELMVTDVLSKALSAGFFHPGIFETYGVLTSDGIQERFFTAVERRKKVEIFKEFFLLDPEKVPKNAVWKSATTMPKNGFLGQKSINVDINSINVCNNSINVNRNEQSKVKNSSSSSSSETAIHADNNSINVDRNSIHADNNSISADNNPINVSRNSPSVDRNPQEEERGFAEAAQLFSDNIHPVTGEIEKDMLADLYAEHGGPRLMEAIREAALQHGRSVKYVGAILERWKEYGFKAPMGNGGKSRGRKGEASGNSRTGQGKVRDDAAKWQSETSGWN